MDWRTKCVVRILLLVARIVGPDEWAEEIRHLGNHISTWAPKDE